MCREDILLVSLMMQSFRSEYQYPAGDSGNSKCISSDVLTAKHLLRMMEDLNGSRKIIRTRFPKDCRDEFA